MAPDQVIVVNGQEVIPARAVRAAPAVQVVQQVRPAHSYVIQRTSLVPVQYVVPLQNRAVWYRYGNEGYSYIVNEQPVIYCQSILEGWHIVAVILALLVMLAISLGTILAVSLIVSGQWI